MSKSRIIPTKHNNKIVYIEATSLGGEVNISDKKILDSEEIVDSIKATSELVLSSVESLKAQKIKVEFKLELAYKSGKILSYLVNGDAKGSIGVTVEWEYTDKNNLRATPPT